jgi:hypothetical protein
MARKRVKNNEGRAQRHRTSARVKVASSATVLAIAVVGVAGLASGASGSGGAPARQASRVRLVENAQLHLASEGEATLNERGQATGTFNAPVTSQLNLSPGHVTAIFTVYPKGGSISGKAQARFVVKNSVGYYGGTLTIVHGTGVYRHASGSSIGISGTINRLTFGLTIKVNGWMSL